MFLEKVFGHSTSLFGGNTDKTHQSIFGGFSGLDSKINNQTTSIFSNTGIPQAANQNEMSKLIFSPFGDNNLTKSNSNISSGTTFGGIAGSSVAPLFGNQTKDKTISFADMVNNKDQIKDNKENIAETIGTKTGIGSITSDQSNIDCFSGLAGGDDFASLAAKGSSNPIGFQKSESGGFFGLTHQDAFKNFKASCKTSTPTATHDNSVENVNDDDNYDPHYEPIIALPNEIVVSTGEENEVKLFGERSTIFRYNSESKEWKERGKFSKKKFLIM